MDSREMQALSKVVRVRYENGVLKPLEPLDMQEGGEVVAVLKRDESFIAQKFYGVAKRRRPQLSGEFLKVLEKIENEDIL